MESLTLIDDAEEEENDEAEKFKFPADKRNKIHAISTGGNCSHEVY